MSFRCTFKSVIGYNLFAHWEGYLFSVEGMSGPLMGFNDHSDCVATER